MSSFTSTLGALALAAAAFVLGTHAATCGSGGALGARVSAALADPDPITRTAALVPVLREVDASDLSAVEEAYRGTFPSGGPSATAIVLLSEAWAEQDPAGALERIGTWPEPGGSTARKALLRAWARGNRTAALQWLGGVSDDGTLHQAAFEGWAEAGDPTMWDRVAEMVDPTHRDLAATALMQTVVAREGFDGLLARVDALPDASPNGFKAAAIGTATVLVADHDPARAAAYVDRQVGGPYEAGLLPRVAIRWVVRDGRDALDHLIDRPASQERDVALREAYLTWLRRENEAALAWMPESAAQDPRFTPIVDVYAVALANHDPEHRGDAIRSAIRWSEGISDAASRQETLLSLGVLWLYYEPDAAPPWLVQNGIDAEVRKRLEFYESISQERARAPH